MDDDIDLETEPINRPPKAAPAPKPPDPPAQAKPAPPDKPAAAAKPGAAAPAAPPKPLPARKRGPLGNITAAVGGRFEGLRPPPLNARTAVWGLLVLLVIVQLLANLAPVRLSILGFWHFDVPKALAFIVDVAIGVGLTLLWQRCTARKPEPPAEEPQPPAA